MGNSLVNSLVACIVLGGLDGWFAIVAGSTVTDGNRMGGRWADSEVDWKGELHVAIGGTFISVMEWDMAGEMAGDWVWRVIVVLACGGRQQATKSGCYKNSSCEIRVIGDGHGV